VTLVLAEHDGPVDSRLPVAHSSKRAQLDGKKMNARLLLVISPLVLTPVAYAQSGDSPLQPLFECRNIADDDARLACLDAAVETLYGNAESGEVVAVDRGQIEAAEESIFGLSLPNFSIPGLGRRSGGEGDLVEADATAQSPDRIVHRTEDGDIERIENLSVTDIEINRAGDVVVTLANGQVWRQTDGTHIQGLRGGVRPGLTANIRSGALGSYFMRLNNGGRWFRAERVE